MSKAYMTEFLETIQNEIKSYKAFYWIVNNAELVTWVEWKNATFKVKTYGFKNFISGGGYVASLVEKALYLFNDKQVFKERDLKK